MMHDPVQRDTAHTDYSKEVLLFSQGGENLPERLRHHMGTSRRMSCLDSQPMNSTKQMMYNGLFYENMFLFMNFEKIGESRPPPPHSKTTLR